MSASREKKDRQGVAAQSMTQKQLKEAKEAQAAKRKTITYWIVGVVIAILVAALLVWDSGFFQKRAVGATVGDETLTVAEMQYYYGAVRTSELNMQQQYAQLAAYGITAPMPENCVAYNFESTEGDQQVYNTATSQTYAEHFRESALTTVKQVVALNSAAKAESYTLSAESKTELQDGIKSLKEQVKTGGWASFSAYLGTAYGSYVDEGVFNRCQEMSTLANDYQTYHQDSLTYTTSQMAAYEQENPALLQSYDYGYAYISGDPTPKTDADGKSIDPTEEEKTAAAKEAKEKADAIVKGVQDAATDKKADTFNTLVKENVSGASDNNVKTNILGTDAKQNDYSNEYFDWLSSSERKEGDINAVLSGSSYHVVLYLGAQLDDTPTVDVRHILIKAETPVDDEATADVDESKNAPSQEALDAAKAKAQALLDEFNALPDDKRTADAFGKMANENSEDGGSNTKGGLYRYVAEGDMVPEFDAWIFDSARKSGDTDLTANVEEGSQYYGYHVMYYVGQDGPEWHKLAEDALRSDEMTKWLETVQEPFTATWTDSGSNSIGK